MSVMSLSSDQPASQLTFHGLRQVLCLFEKMIGLVLEPLLWTHVHTHARFKILLFKTHLRPVLPVGYKIHQCPAHFNRSSDTLAGHVLIEVVAL